MQCFGVFFFIFVFISCGSQQWNGDLQTVLHWTPMRPLNVKQNKTHLNIVAETVLYYFTECRTLFTMLLFSRSLMFKRCMNHRNGKTKHTAFYSWWLHFREKYKLPSSTVTLRDGNYTKMLSMLWWSYLNLNHIYS